MLEAAKRLLSEPAHRPGAGCADREHGDGVQVPRYAATSNAPPAAISPASKVSK
jgi:hypothetical protein